MGQKFYVSKTGNSETNSYERKFNKKVLRLFQEGTVVLSSERIELFYDLLINSLLFRRKNNKSESPKVLKSHLCINFKFFIQKFHS